MRYKVMPTRTGYTVQCQMSINKRMHTIHTEEVVCPRGKAGHSVLKLALLDLAPRRPRIQLKFADKS